MKLKVGLISLSILSSTLLSGCSSIFAIGEEEFSCPGRENGVLCKGPREVYDMTNNQEEITFGTSSDVDYEDLDEEDLAKVGDADWLIENFERIEAEALDDPDDETVLLYRAAVKAKLERVTGDQGAQLNSQTVYAPRTSNRQDPSHYDKASVLEKEQQPKASPNEYTALKAFNVAPHDMAPEPLALLKPAEVMRILISPYKDDNKDLHMPGYVYVDLHPRTWIVGEQATTSPQRIIPLDIRQKTQSQMAEERNRTRGVSGLGVGQIPNVPGVTAPQVGQQSFDPQKSTGQN